MKRGRKPLVAKVQHFYDILTQNGEKYSNLALSTNALDLKDECIAFMAEYAYLTGRYQELFQDILFEKTTSEN